VSCAAVCTPSPSGSPAAQIATSGAAPDDRERVGAAHRFPTTSPPAAQIAARSAERDRS